MNGLRLNRYLAASGIASRRKSADIVRSGRVTVNGKAVANPFREVFLDDRVAVDGSRVYPLGRPVIILLNKAKGTLSTVSDDRGRRTVLDGIKVPGRLFPVGRLDRDTTGALLLTNDGDLAYRLTHPKFEVEKVYRVTTDRPVSRVDLRKIESGIDMGEGQIGRGEVLDPKEGSMGKRETGRTHVRLRLTHGKKREIRRMVSALGYGVVHLHRESFAGLGVKGMDPGEWRELTRKEGEALETGAQRIEN